MKWNKKKTDHEILIAKFRLKLKKVRKTTTPFRYDLNQTAYDYTVEVRKRCQGLETRDKVSEKLWTEVFDIAQEAGIKTIPKNVITMAGWLPQTRGPQIRPFLAVSSPP